ncbi:N-acetylmuramoyl-L-alanine amidase [Canicola haemoglobinophilus]|uniref:N-acetylmuramoyl-l-alanine amidase-like protein n=1 Tax=Canicola haemoglobinophilus TaxID=733 RepID=A0A1V4B3Z0_9PAST|nr:N-acetylmuramoyl-L-alanine amidase [Canicola haemoglobinophilus]OOS02179.1 N-acetylmuramoyl-L-alanine amidase [Canicola haemoglobinophilus]STO55346.1 n-acetylmuramoyl-l-alanine amidase-like protein [Canicola haemoglobinophilus]STO59648.1 n-acetylmuramoyl-l-alanine amidase-like protein [Canicola haemoglobinophilus]STO69085.1 n-acetylmuramoyl-l-alanine amidase-like protein [Canicola haemoglobinophilus]
MSLPILKIVIHCSATRNGKSLKTNNQSAAQVIDGWHKDRGYSRIGYHFVIDTDGTVETGRKVGEIGAHVKGHNRNSVGICLVGGITEKGKNHGEYTEAQWHALHNLLRQLESQHPKAKIYGHRDLSPDLNGDGSITPNEWLKACPCFDVWEWLDSEEIINHNHLFQ